MKLSPAPRGQVFPVWLGTLLVFLVTMSVLSFYGSIARAQMRAQAAADSAASAVVSIQSQEWNEMVALLYAGSLEEYRLRTILAGLRYAALGSGGCGTNGESCDKTYHTMQQAYLKSLARYDTLSKELSKVTTTESFANIYNDGQIVLQALQAPCNGKKVVPGALDCGVTVSLPQAGVTVRTGTGNANLYPQYMNLPSYHQTDVSTATTSLYAPIAVEVAACSKVYPLAPSFLGIPLPSVTVVARGAATNAAVSQEWNTPSDTLGPNGQPEAPSIAYAPPNQQGWWMYGVAFSSWHHTLFQADPVANEFTSTSSFDIGYSARLAWWGPIPIHSFMGKKSEAELFPNGCK